MQVCHACVPTLSIQVILDDCLSRKQLIGVYWRYCRYRLRKFL